MVGLASPACTATDAFSCRQDGDCINQGDQGFCEAGGYCSFRDSTCASGRRYGSLNPSGVAESCVLDDTTTSGTATSTGGSESESSSTSGDRTTTASTRTTTEAEPDYGEPSLWLSEAQTLTYILLDRADVTVAEVAASTFNPPVLSTNTQPGLTLLRGGDLLMSRAQAATSGEPARTELYLVLDPPRAPAEVQALPLGSLGSGLHIEALYSDCEDRVYLMDTGGATNPGSARLLELTGDYRAGDFAHELVFTIDASLGFNFDDLSPGISGAGRITDQEGYAIDSGNIFAFSVVNGPGQQLAEDFGRLGIHALGGPLFDDGQARAFVVNNVGDLFYAAPGFTTLSDSLVNLGTAKGGLTGPLTGCG